MTREDGSIFCQINSLRLRINLAETSSILILLTFSLLYYQVLKANLAYTDNIGFEEHSYSNRKIERETISKFIGVLLSPIN